MKRALRVSLVSVLSSLLLLCLLEAGVRLFLPQKSRTTYLAGDSWTVKDSLLGYTLRPGCVAEVQTPEFTFRFTISDQGLRDRVLHASGPNEHRKRILILGDSFAFGAGNAYESIWPVIFETAVRRVNPGIEVIKAGVMGYDTRTETLYLERLLPEYEPDLVVLNLLPNDLFTNSPIEAGADTASWTGTEATVKSLHLARLASRILLSCDWAYSRIYLMTPRGRFFRTAPSDQVREQMQVTQRLLERARELCSSHGARFLVLSIPQQFQVVARSRGYSWQGIDPGIIDTEMRAFADEAGFGWVDALPDLAREYSGGADLYYRYDGHLTGAGNQVVAESFLRRFVELYPDWFEAE